MVTATGRLCLVILLSAVLSSCVTTRKVYLEIMQPAAREMPFSFDSVVILNRSIYPELDSAGNRIDSDTILFNNELARECIYGMVDALQMSVPGDAGKVDIEVLEMEDRDPLHADEPLSLNEYRALIRMYGEKPVISLEFLDVVVGQDYASTPVDNGDGGIIMTFTERVLVSPKACFRAYRPGKDYLADQYLSADTMIWISTTSGFFDPAAGELAGAERILEEVYWYGYHYVHLLVPHWLGVDRFYYATGNRTLSLAAGKVEENDWVGAAELWRTLVNHRNRWMAARARFNMAVAAEVNDMIPAAIGWAEQSFMSRNTRTTKRYISLLRERLKEQETIRRQLR